jgi:hypothetical protein
MYETKPPLDQPTSSGEKYDKENEKKRKLALRRREGDIIFRKKGEKYLGLADQYLDPR